MYRLIESFPEGRGRAARKLDFGAPEVDPPLKPKLAALAVAVIALALAVWVWTQGDVLELESGTNLEVADELANRGHKTMPVLHLGGGMNGVRRHGDGNWEGAACWRADGTAVALGGGMARPGVRFWPDRSHS